MRVVLFLILLSSSAFANELSIDDKQQGAIAQICDIAATNPNTTREVRAQLAAWCVAWQQRIQQAAEKAEKATPSPTAIDPPNGEQKK